jgi:streptogramin lyase
LARDTTHLPGHEHADPWTLPGTGYLWGTAFDNAGQVWTTDSAHVVTYRFTPGTSELCTSPLPDAGISDHILVGGGSVWLGDKRNARIVKLDPAADEFTSWQLPADAVPQGPALAENGDLWWTDQSRGELVHLEPVGSLATAHALPAGTVPVMIALDSGKVWSTSSINGTVGMLEPAVATGTSSDEAITTAPVTPDCRNLGAGIASAVIARTCTLAWSSSMHTRTVSGSGLAVYQLPVDVYW